MCAPPPPQCSSYRRRALLTTDDGNITGAGWRCRRIWRPNAFYQFQPLHPRAPISLPAWRNPITLTYFLQHSLRLATIGLYLCGCRSGVAVQFYRRGYKLNMFYVDKCSRVACGLTWKATAVENARFKRVYRDVEPMHVWYIGYELRWKLQGAGWNARKCL